MRKTGRIKLSGALALGIALCCGGNADADRISFEVGDLAYPDFAEIVAAPLADAGFGDDANASLAQTLTVTNTFDAGAIYIPYRTDLNGGSNDWSMTVRIVEVADITASNFVAVSTNYSGTFTFPNIGGTVSLATIELDTPVTLTTGVGYAIEVVEENGADFNPGWEWMRPTAEAYAGGVMYEDGLIKNDGARDLSLAVSSTPPPTARDDEYILPYGVSSTNVAAPGVLVNDVGFDSAVLVTNLSFGSLTFNADGSFSCSGLVNGSNTFSYAVVSGSVTSAPATVLLFATLAAEIPIAVDDAYSMDLAFADEITGNVLNNDTNLSVALEMFAALVDTNSLSGTVNLSSDGAFVYTPSESFTGTDSFTYVAYTVAATSEVATVTLLVEDTSDLYMGIDDFESYDNSASVDVTAIPAALLNWDPGGSGQIEIQDRNDGQVLKVGWKSSSYRGAVSETNVFSGIASTNVEYWLYAELEMAAVTSDGHFGVTRNSSHSISSGERGDYAAGVRFTDDGVGTLALYALTGGDSSTDVLLGSGYPEDTPLGVWLNINSAANTYDIYVGDTGAPGTLGTQVGTNIAFTAGPAELSTLIASAKSAMYVDNIMRIDPNAFAPAENLPATIIGSGVSVVGDTLQLTIGLDADADASAYWPIATDNLGIGTWVHVAHSDAPDGTFAVTDLSVASGDATTKVIYVKTTNTVEFIRIENNQ